MSVVRVQVGMLVAVLFASVLFAEPHPRTETVGMLPGEHWWGCANYFGPQMPFTERTGLVIDLTKRNYANQYASFMVSDRGREIWCDDQCRFEITNGEIRVMSSGAAVEVKTAGRNLREAYLSASRSHFPPSGRTPDLTFFAAPQYNTWIELTYNQNEKDILAYAQSMLDNGCPPGVFMIDDTWQEGYGTWEFAPRRFSDPKGMVKRLHDQGFKVILWICPWVSMDSPAYRLLRTGIDPFRPGRQPAGGFLESRSDDDPNCWEPAADTWWNGRSALLDFTHPNAVRWFGEQCDRLVRDYGVDGFKFDGGALGHYVRGYRSHRNIASGDQANGFLAFALRYPTCEYRHAWKNGGQPIVERLHDKNHAWGDVRALVPSLVAGGLLGHPFMCPDMVGGGEWSAFLPGSHFDEELFIRSAQVHALCGQMQFSASPWRVLSPEGRKIVRDLVKMRQEKFAARFVELARECGHTGEPMIRHMDYMFPGNGYAGIADQFVMGDFLMVAPQVEKGAAAREVEIPPGRWVADDGTAFDGPARITVKTPLSRLPYFVRSEK